MIHAPGVAALQRWGLLDQVIATGCPPDRHLLVRLRAVHDRRHAPAVGRQLDRATRRVAPCSTRSSSTPPTAAGAEVREGFTVDEVVVEDGVVVGIRGHDAGGSVGGRAGPRRHRRRRPQLPRREGRAARAVQREADAAVELLHVLERPAGRRRSRRTSVPTGVGPLLPTNDDLTLLVVGWPYAEANGLQGRRRGQLPEDARARSASSPSGCAARSARSASPAASVPNFFRKPYGPGWALVGDAGYNKDPITAQGISDAFRDAEACAAALDDVFTGARSFDDAMADYHRARDDARDADLRVHDAARDARAAAARDAAAAGRRARQPRGAWTRS